MLEPFEDKFGDFLNDGDVGRTEELANLLELVDGSDFVLIGGGAVNHPGPPVGFHSSPALIH